MKTAGGIGIDTDKVHVAAEKLGMRGVLPAVLLTLPADLDDASAKKQSRRDAVAAIATAAVAPTKATNKDASSKSLVNADSSNPWLAGPAPTESAPAGGEAASSQAGVVGAGENPYLKPALDTNKFKVVGKRKAHLSIDANTGAELDSGLSLVLVCVSQYEL